MLSSIARVCSIARVFGERMRTVALTFGLACASCSNESVVPRRDAGAAAPDPAPPTARLEPLADLRADLEAVRHPGDGGGRAWISTVDGVKPRVEARSPMSAELVFAVGPEGIAVGGVINMLVGPYWRWSSPQLDDPSAPGFTRVACDATGVELEESTPAPWSLFLRVGGRALVEGETIAIHYGAGELGAKSDDFAERDSRFWIRVDADGDGVSRLIADSPRVDVGPGPAHRLHGWLPATARVSDEVRLTLAFVDRWANAGVSWAGVVELESSAPGLVLPAAIEFTLEDAGAKSVLARVERAGRFSVRVRSRAASSDASESMVLQGETNPMWVDAGDRILWGDLHGHSNYSDGTGVPDDYYRYARDIAGLDVVALTDHDHWGIEFLDQNPTLWSDIERATASFHAPGRFVTILGFEWTNWIHGHRHALFFADRGPIHSSLDPRADTPSELWSLLRGEPALSVAHHPAGGPVAVNWTYPPDVEVEPVVEIVSVHGSSESLDSPQVIYDPVPGHFARDALLGGARLGFIGSGDSHDGHPGLAHMQGGCGGLAAILSEDATREGVLGALRARACYATSGPRFVLRATVGDARMGSVIEVPRGGKRGALDVRVGSPSPLARLELILESGVAAHVECGGVREFEHAFDLDPLPTSRFAYVRVVATDDHFAVSSPFFFE